MSFRWLEWFREPRLHESTCAKRVKNWHKNNCLGSITIDQNRNFYNGYGADSPQIGAVKFERKNEHANIDAEPTVL